MFNNKTIWTIISLLIAGFLTVVLFQNCAQQKLESQPIAPNYSSGIQKLSNETNSISPTFCFEGSIKCYKKIYSPYVSDSLTSSTECTEIDNHKVCFDLDSYTYDTKNALASCTDCDSSASLPNGRYHRDEITCWMQVGNTDNPSFYSIKSSLQEALSDNIRLCQLSVLSKGDQ